jgi:hypothetical protein
LNKLYNQKVKNIANTDWIDELSEEEQSVLKQAHKIDSMIRENKKIKIGILEDIKAED